MVEQFREDFTPIEIELVDSTGKKDVKKSTFMSSRAWRNTMLFLNDDKKDALEKNMLFMATVFGGSPGDYEKYSGRLLSKVIEYYTKRVSGPLD